MNAKTSAVSAVLIFVYFQLISLLINFNALSFRVVISIAVAVVSLLYL
jgi:hypothetical protein